MGYRDCTGYVAQALQAGVSQAQIDEFKAANTNSDGTWDCHRLLDAFGGSREVAVGSQGASAIATAAASMPPILPMTTGGDQKMFLTLAGVPTGTGSGAPGRQLAQYATSPIGPGGGALPESIGGLNMMTVLILAAIAGVAWYLYK